MVKGKMLSGSFSVEFIFIMPIIIFSLFAMLYLTFYEHDKVAIESKTNQLLMREAEYLTNAVDVQTGELDYESYMHRSILYPINFSKEEEQEKLQQILKKALPKQLCLSNIQNIASTVSYDNASVVVQAKLNVSNIPVLHYFQNQLSYQIEVSNETYNPMDFVRKYDSAISVLDNTKLYETLQTIAQKINEFNQ